MNKIVKILLCYLVLPVIILLLVWAIITNVRKPVVFNKQKDAREEVAIQQLKDIRDLQVAFRATNGHFTASMDSLIDYYNNGSMDVLMKIGSSDDSLSVVHTEAVKKANRGITAQGLYELYLKGDKDLVFTVDNKMPVKDTLFKGRTDFDVNSLKYIPFSNNQSEVIMNAVVNKVSGVNVPLFEAKIPYKILLQGLDNQLRINLDSERRAANKYEGLQVGSIDSPNNNAGNWE